LGRLEINLGLSSLWRRRLVLRSIRLDDVDPAGQAGGGPGPSEIPLLPGIIHARPPPGPPRTSALRRGRIVYDDPASALRIRAQDATASLFPGRDAMSATLVVPELALDAGRVHERVEQVEAEVRVAPTRLDVRRLAATWEKSRLTV